MALLNRGNTTVMVYPQEDCTDSDGNPSIRASTTGVEMIVMIQARPQSGTSARRAEQDQEGFETEEIYRMRFRRGEDPDLGPEAYIVWNGQRYSIAGLPIHYMGSSRTEHSDYTLKRT